MPVADALPTDQGHEPMGEEENGSGKCQSSDHTICPSGAWQRKDQESMNDEMFRPIDVPPSVQIAMREAHWQYRIESSDTERIWVHYLWGHKLTAIREQITPFTVMVWLEPSAELLGRPREDGSILANINESMEGAWQLLKVSQVQAFLQAALRGEDAMQAQKLRHQAQHIASLDN